MASAFVFRWASRLGVTMALMIPLACGNKHAKHPPKSAASSAAPTQADALPMFVHSPAEVDAFVTAKTAGYALDTVVPGNFSAQTKGPMTGLDARVQAYFAWDTTAVRGKCFLTVVRLGAGADFDPAVKHDGVWGFQTQDASGPDAQHSDAVYGNAIVMDLGCPQVSGTIKAWMFAYSAPNGLGVGPFQIQTWVKSISERELKDLASHPAPAHK
jgi:hypothetical protein